MESIFQAKVLVVDDNPALLELLGQTLTDAGYPAPPARQTAPPGPGRFWRNFPRI